MIMNLDSFHTEGYKNFCILPGDYDYLGDYADFHTELWAITLPPEGYWVQA